MAGAAAGHVCGHQSIGQSFSLVVLPLVYFEVLLRMTNSLSTEFRVEKLSDLFRTVILALIGISSTVFLALIGLGGMSGAAVDGLSVRAVKYAASTFVPVVGGMLSDAYETMAGGALLLKNAFGLVGMLIIILLLLVPAGENIRGLSAVQIHRSDRGTIGRKAGDGDAQPRGR